MPQLAGAFTFLSMNQFVWICICFAGFAACNSSAGGNANKTGKAVDRNSRKVLVELFTSQGCSSCPAADRVVEQMATSDTNFIALSFHVDYWDRLGWKDPFSHHDYTVRQQEYAQALHASSVYTPQAVVQGQYQMVGSNKPGIVAAVAKAGATTPDVSLSVKTTMTGNVLTLSYHLNAIDSSQQIAAVLVQTKAETNIRRGENEGLQWKGFNVVRMLKTAAISGNEGVLQLTMPADLTSENASVVVFVQNVNSKAVTAVEKIAL